MRVERVIAQLRASIQRNVESGNSEIVAQQIMSLLILTKERILELETENAKLRRQSRTQDAELQCITEAAKNRTIDCLIISNTELRDLKKAVTRAVRGKK